MSQVVVALGLAERKAFSEKGICGVDGDRGKNRWGALITR
jgi:hypothetical protein